MKAFLLLSCSCLVVCCAPTSPRPVGMVTADVTTVAQLTDVVDVVEHTPIHPNPNRNLLGIYLEQQLYVRRRDGKVFALFDPFGTGAGAAPVEVAAFEHARLLYSSESFSCAVTEENRVRCFDSNAGFLLRAPPSLLPRALAQATDVQALALETSGEHWDRISWAQRSDGSWLSWSRYSDGPVATPPAGVISAVNRGSLRACEHLVDGTPRCASPELDAVRGLPGMSNAVEIARGNGSSCARLDDGEVRCWTAADALSTPVAELRPSISLVVAPAEPPIRDSFCSLGVDDTVQCFDDPVIGGPVLDLSVTLPQCVPEEARSLARVVNASPGATPHAVRYCLDYEEASGPYSCWEATGGIAPAVARPGEGNVPWRPTPGPWSIVAPSQSANQQLCSSTTNTCRTITLRGLSPRAQPQTDGTHGTLIVTPDGRKVLAVFATEDNSHGVLQIFDARTGTRLREVALGTEGSWVELERLEIVGSNLMLSRCHLGDEPADCEVLLVSTTDGRVLRRLPVNVSAGAWFHANGNVWTFLDGKTQRLEWWDVASSRKLKSLDVTSWASDRGAIVQLQDHWLALLSGGSDSPEPYSGRVTFFDLAQQRQGLTLEPPVCPP